MQLPNSSTVWSSFIDDITWNSIENEPPNKKLITSIALVLLSHIGLSLSLSPKQISTRMILLTVYMTGMVIFWVYNSGLISVLTVDKAHLEIKSFEVKLSPKIFMLSFSFP